MPGRGDLAERVLDFDSALKYCNGFANGGCAPSLISRCDLKRSFQCLQFSSILVLIITTGMEAAFNGRRWTGQNLRSLADGGRQQWGLFASFTASFKQRGALLIFSLSQKSSSAIPNLFKYHLRDHQLKDSIINENKIVQFHTCIFSLWSVLTFPKIGKHTFNLVLRWMRLDDQHLHHLCCWMAW